MSAVTTTCRWLAVIPTRCRAGFTLEAWPDERDGYLRSLGSAVVGEFDTVKEAEAALRRRLQPIKKARLHDPAPLATNTPTPARRSESDLIF